MAMQMAGAHLPHLLSWLEHHLPQSFMVHGQLKHHLRGQFPDVDFFVDRWPQPQAVVARLDLGGEQLVSNEGKTTTIIEGVFCLNYKALSGLLWNPAVVDWNQRVLLCRLPTSLMPELRAAVKETGKSVLSCTCVLMKATPQDVKPIPIPEGVKALPVTSAEIRMIYSTWEFAYERPLAVVQKSIHPFPSVYLATDKGQHVGHMVGATDGTMKMLYVNPDFRGKGYAKVIVSQLAQKYFDQGEDACVCIVEDNVASQHLHKSLGFKVVVEVKLHWMTCE